MTQNLAVNPVAKITVGPVPKFGLVVMRPDFLESMTDKTVHVGRSYALMPSQALQLANELMKALGALKPQEPPPEGEVQKH